VSQTERRLTLIRRCGQHVPCDESHPPGIVPDID
jgi:hypothetical protein